ncbi:MAG TPA: pyridoxal phosphate-dependent aminotransferase, partial [Streptosporangiaceae bacterium]
DEVLSDLGFPGEQAPPPLAAFGNSVISVGSLSKTVWAGLRIGWVRAPRPTIARLARLLAVHDLGGNIPGQLAAADLLPRLQPLAKRWAVEREARHDHLRAELARHLPGWDVPPVRGGQTLWVRMPRGDGTSFAQAALRHQVAVLPGNGLDASGHSAEYLRLHFLASPDELTEAVRRLAAAWRAYCPPAFPVPAPAALTV